MKDVWMSTTKLAEAMDVSRQTVTNWIKDGIVSEDMRVKIPGTRKWRINASKFCPDMFGQGGESEE